MGSELFPRYPAPPDEVLGIAAGLVWQVTQIGATAESVSDAMMRAAAAVEGDLQPPLHQAPQPVLTAAAELSLAARFAAGALSLFAQGISAFNAGVDALNAEGAGMGPPMTPDAVTELRAGLAARYARLEADLDQVARDSAAMLDRGPNEADMARLGLLGLLPPADPFQNPALLSALDKPGAGCLSPDAGVSPQQAAAWWASLTLAERLAVMAAYPHRIGNTDGLPAEVRDEANRTMLQRDLADLEAQEAAGTLSDEEARALQNIRAVLQSINNIEQRTDPLTLEPLRAQLYIYDPYAFDGDGRAAVAVGNLDTADHVAVLVPGMGTTAAGMTSLRALTVYEQSRAGSSDSVAVLDWVGYDAPSGNPFTDDLAGVVTQDMARSGAAQLAEDVTGLRAMRGDDQPHITVVGNSYGATTTAIAASKNGLAVDDVILTGSPGAGYADHASDFTTGQDHTWVGSASRDWVTSLGVTGWMDPSQVVADAVGLPPELMGNDPAEDDFGANRFQAESVDRGAGWNIADHGRYYQRNSESLHNIAAIITGNYDEVRLAEHRYDPWYRGMQDPEADRTPVEIGT